MLELRYEVSNASQEIAKSKCAARLNETLRNAGGAIRVTCQSTYCNLLIRSLNRIRWFSG